MSGLRIEAADANDAALIAELADATWREHYVPIIGAEQVTYMLARFQSAAAITAQMASGELVYHLLHLGDEAAGYLAVGERDGALFLSKLYLLATHRGAGHGRAALSWVTAETARRSLDRIRLTVNKGNALAIRAYERAGFERVDDVCVDIGGGFVMDDWVMERAVEA